MQIKDQPKTNDHGLHRSLDEDCLSTHEQSQEFLIDDGSTDQSTNIIYDYFIWSLINSIFGFWLCGLIATIYSLRARYSRQQNNLDLARTYSRRALVWNAAATLLAPVAWAGYIYMAKVLNGHH